MARIRIRVSAWLVTTALACVKNATAMGGVVPWQDSPQPHGPGGTVLIDHQPTNVGGLAADTQFSGFPFAERSADDFLVSQAAVINRLVWWGFYDLNILPTINDEFRVRVYDQRPSDLLPGTVEFEQSFTNVPRTWTGRFVLVSGAPREFRFEVELPQPLTLSPNSTRWLEIAQIGDPNSFFVWEYSQNTQLNGRAYINSIVGDWTYSGPNTSNGAYQLISVPEPGSCVLVAVAGVALFRR